MPAPDERRVRGSGILSRLLSLVGSERRTLIGKTPSRRPFATLLLLATEPVSVKRGRARESVSEASGVAGSSLGRQS